MMILLDGNYLVALVTVNSPGALKIKGWLMDGKSITTNAVAWSVFCNGPLSKTQKDAAFTVLNRKIVDFTWRETEEAEGIARRLHDRIYRDSFQSAIGHLQDCGFPATGAFRPEARRLRLPGIFQSPAVKNPARGI